MATPSFGAGRSQVFIEPNWEETVNNEIREYWKDTMEEMVAVAQSLVPIRTGALKASIEGRVEFAPRSRPIATVTAGEPYAGFVEYGTGIRGSVTKDPPQVGDLTSDYGYNPEWPGMVAQPYLRPALWHVLRTRFAVGEA